MLGHGHNDHAGAHSGKTVVVLIVLAKLLLVVGALVLLKLGVGYVGASIWVLLFHGVVLVAVVAVVFLRSFRHRALFGSSDHRAGDHSKGIVLHGAAGYDLLACALTFGREGRFRELMLRPARLQPGEVVLDVACGTGTLAIAAKRQVGPFGKVTGLDASPEMIERARTKAEKAGLEIAFLYGTAQELPFHAGQFDIVMGTLMLHHLSKPARAGFGQEARRVLKTGGRLLLIDFGRPVRKSRMPRLHRHGHVDMQAIGKTLAEAGFEIVDIGDVGTKNLRYVRAVSVHKDQQRHVQA